MQENIKHTSIGTASLILGILGVITILNWLNILAWVFIPFVLGLLAIITGRAAKKKGDKYGNIGFILGLIAFILGLTQVIALIFYFWATSMV